MSFINKYFSLSAPDIGWFWVGIYTLLILAVGFVAGVGYSTHVGLSDALIRLIDETADTRMEAMLVEERLRDIMCRVDLEQCEGVGR